MPSPPSTATTVDSLLEGRVLLEQPKHGYRFNVDSVHLAYFSLTTPVSVACDLGCGVGTLGFLLLTLGGAHRVVGIEREPHAAHLARENAARNKLDARYTCIHNDVACEAEATYPLVVMNPPFFAVGPVATDAAKRDARAGKLAPFIDAGARRLGHRGRLCLVYPADNLIELLATLKTHQLEPKRMRFVHSTATKPARVVLVQAQRAKPGGLCVEPPLIERL